jgi:hypothetical protein
MRRRNALIARKLRLRWGGAPAGWKPFEAPFGQAQGRQDKATYEKPQGTRAYPGLQNPLFF